MRETRKKFAVLVPLKDKYKQQYNITEEAYVFSVRYTLALEGEVSEAKAVTCCFYPTQIAPRESVAIYTWSRVRVTNSKKKYETHKLVLVKHCTPVQVYASTIARKSKLLYTQLQDFLS